MALDFPAYLQALRGERQPTCVVHAAPLSGLSQFAQALARRPGFGYLDVLGTVADQPELSARLDQFQPNDLGRLIVRLGQSDVVLVDDLDFLFPIWGRDIHPFQEMVRSLKHPRLPVALAFFVHTRPEWEQWDLLTAARGSRVLRFENLQPIQ
jgi:hypothetical protein